MKKVVFSLFFGFFCLVSLGQQSPQYTQYMVNPYLMNPALSSVEDMTDIKVGHRTQWVGFNQNKGVEGNDGQPNYETTSTSIAPRTYYISGHSPVGRPHELRHYVTEAKSWFGAGGKVVYDKTGPSTWGSYMVSGTYNMAVIKPKGSGIYTKGGLRMSVGMFLGLSQYSLDWSQLEFGDPEEPLAKENIGVQSSYNPDATFGLWLYNESFYAGFSLDHIFGNRLDIKTPEGLNRADFPALARHSFFTLGTDVKIGDMLTWGPSILAKYTSGAPVSVDVNNRLTYVPDRESRSNYWGGLSYRHLDALSIAVGAVISYSYEIAYSYDFTTTDIRTFGNAAATHEITLGFRIEPKKTERNPIYHQGRHSGHNKNGRYTD